MEFRVELAERAQRDLAAIYEYIHAESSERAFEWFNGLEAAILSLASQPEPGTRTRESKPKTTALWQQTSPLSGDLSN